MCCCRFIYIICNIVSIHSSSSAYPVQGRGGRSLLQLPQGETQGARGRVTSLSHSNIIPAS